VWQHYLVFIADENDFNVKKDEAGEPPFRIEYNFELPSWRENFLTEREIKTNDPLKSQAKQQQNNLV